MANEIKGLSAQQFLLDVAGIFSGFLNPMGCHKYRSGYPRVRSHAKYSPPKQWRRIGEEITTMAANLAALMPAPSKAASISCRLATGVSTRPRLSCVRISPADNNDAVDVIASRLRHLHYLRQGVLRATLATLIDAATGTARQRDSKSGRAIVLA